MHGDCGPTGASAKCLKCQNGMSFRPKLVHIQVFRAQSVSYLASWNLMVGFWYSVLCLGSLSSGSLLQKRRYKALITVCGGDARFCREQKDTTNRMKSYGFCGN